MVATLQTWKMNCLILGSPFGQSLQLLNFPGFLFGFLGCSFPGPKKRIQLNHIPRNIDRMNTPQVMGPKPFATRCLAWDAYAARSQDSRGALRSVAGCSGDSAHRISWDRLNFWDSQVIPDQDHIQRLECYREQVSCLSNGVEDGKILPRCNT